MRGLSTLVASAVLGGGLLFGAAPASALDIKDFDFDAIGLRPEIHVVFDLQADNWNAVTSDLVKFGTYYSFTVYKAYALDQGSHISVYLENLNWTHEFQSHKSGNEVFEGQIDLKKSANKLTELKNVAINACRAYRAQGGTPGKDHVIQRTVEAKAYLDLSTVAPVFTEALADRTIDVPYDIVCDANPKWHKPIKPAENFTADKGDFKIQSIDLFLTTFQGQETNPNPGTSCKKLKVTVRIETNKVGGVQYKVWRQPGDAVTKSQVAKFQTEGQFKGRFIIEDAFIETFDKTTYVQYMAEVTSTTFGPSTQWKPITIQCNGGFTTGQPQGGGDIVPSFKITSTDLKIIGLEGKGCPTKAFVTATFVANKPGTFKYFIGTSLNKNKQGQLEAKKVGNLYRAQETLTVDITKSGKLTAHARPVDFPAASAFTSKAYNCGGIVSPTAGALTE
jgi:hypothetical protein